MIEKKCYKKYISFAGYRVIKCGWSVQMLDKSSSYSSETSFDSGMSNNISSVVAFQRWWILKSQIFGQKSTDSKETIVFCEYNDFV